MNAPGYIDLLESGGLVITHREDASAPLVKILDDMKAKLGALSAWQGIAGQLGFDPVILNQAPQVIQGLRRSVEEVRLEYWLFAARKP